MISKSNKHIINGFENMLVMLIFKGNSTKNPNISICLKYAIHDSTDQIEKILTKENLYLL